MQFNFISLCDLYGIDEIFKNIKISSRYDKELLINTILSECMMYQPLYVELPILNQMIINFFNVNYTNFDKIGYLYDLEYKTDYNPIWNKDGTYQESEEYTKDNTFNSNSNNTNTRNEKLEDNSTEINQVSAYDSNDFQNNNKNTIDNISTNVISDNGSNSKNDTGKEFFTHSINKEEKGNIGVTTTMAMIKEEIETHQDSKYNKYEIIAKKFYDEFFIHY